MVTVIPIFLYDTDKIWNEVDGMELIRKFLNTVADSTDIKYIFVFTNNEQVMNLSNRIGLESIFIAGKISNHYSICLPMGSIDSLTYLKKSHNIFFDRAMVLNFRNPLISTQLIRDAIKSFKGSDFPILLSVVKSIDHPSQLYQHYTGTYQFIHFIDPNISPITYIEYIIKYFQMKYDGIRRSCSKSVDLSLLLIENVISNIDRSFYILTKPFFFDWESIDIYKREFFGLYIPVSSGLHIPILNQLNLKLIALEETSNLNFNKLPYSFWIYETKKLARILFKFQISPELYEDMLFINKNCVIYGVLFDDNYSRIDTLICKHPDDNHFSLIMNSNNILSKNCITKIAPVSTTGSFQKESLDLNPLNRINDFFLLSDADTSGILQTILRLSKGYSFNHREPFPPQGDLWKFIPGQLLNMITGLPILGRQDFPEVFEPEGSFIILENDVLDSLDNNIMEGKSSGFILSHKNSIQINSQLDLLRYQAILKVNRVVAMDEHQVR